MSVNKDNWGSKIGVILAVSGSAVGLGNFLRFPGKAVSNGAGAFMIPYFISFIIIGIPICWAEWSMGRFGGKKGSNNPPGIFGALGSGSKSKYLGVFGIMIPLVIYMYYIYIEAWCLAYAVSYAVGALDLGTSQAAYGAFFEKLVGMSGNGVVFTGDGFSTLIYVAISFVINFFLIYKGVAKGIERMSKIAMPALLFSAVIILIRVLTLGTPDPAFPDRNVFNALGYMWNPDWSVLKDPKVWMEATGQMFFSLSIGFGLILTYASYVKKNDDIVLSGLTASATNEFAEVVLGGFITIPAAFLFLGAAPLAVMQGSTLGLGFYTLPVVFGHMPAGQFFGFLWFFLLFLAAITSSVSMLQPSIAFFEQGFKMTRKVSVATLGLITGVGALFVIFLSKDLIALDTMDFWAGTALIYVMATILVFFFSYKIGIKDGLKEANRGATIKIPKVFGFLLKYITPYYLIIIFFLWLRAEIKKPRESSYFGALIDNPAALVTFIALLCLMGFLFLMVKLAGKNWDKEKAVKEIK